MCVNDDILDSRIWENYETNMVFFICFIYIYIYIGYGFKIKASVLHEHVMNNQEHVNNTYEHLRMSRMFKHIRGN